MLDPSRQSGLRDVEFVRGSAKAAQFGDAHECLNSGEVDLHGWTLRPSGLTMTSARHCCRKRINAYEICTSQTLRRFGQ
jgi:hypothetical protein